MRQITAEVQMIAGTGALPSFRIGVAQNEDVLIPLRYVDKYGQATSLAGKVIHLRVKESVSGALLITKRSSDSAEISIDNEEAGYASAYLERSETAGLNPASHYLDVWTVATADGDQDRVSRGTLKVDQGGSFAP